MEQTNMNFNFSIDTLNKENYEKIRINASFDKTMAHFHYVKDFCKKNNRFIGIVCCFMKDNWQDIPELVQKCNEWNIKIQFNRVWFPHDKSIDFLDDKELDRVISTYSVITLPEYNEIQKHNKLAFIDLIKHCYKVKEKAQNTNGKVKMYFSLTSNELLKVLKNKVDNFTQNNIINKEHKEIILSRLEEIFSSFKEEEIKSILTVVLEGKDIDYIFFALLDYSRESIMNYCRDILRCTKNAENENQQQG